MVRYIRVDDEIRCQSRYFVLCLFTGEKEESANFALVDFYDSIGVVPMDWITKKTTADGSVDDKMVTVQWRDGNKRIPYDAVILFKGTACRKLSLSSYLILIKRNIV